MGRLAKLLSFVRVIRNGVNASDVKIDPGGGPNITAEHFSSAGDDSHPLPGDFVVTNDVQRSGGEVIVGYLDPLNEQKANPGDKRIYARDADTGAVIVEIWLKNDGTVTTSNDNGSMVLNPDGSIKGGNGSGSFELQAGGDFLVNGVTIDTSGNINSPASITATVNVSAATVAAATGLTVAGKEMSGHTHSQGNDSNGDNQQNTSGPV